MKLLNKLERKFGRYAIPNLTVYLLACYVIGYGIHFMLPDLFQWLALEPYYILQGQVWRIISWVLIPPGGNLFTIVIMLFLYYSIGTSLERTWGAFRFNIYIFSGILFTVLGAFILFFITGSIYSVGGSFSTYYVNMSMFLAFAASYPNMELLLFFILPVKIKWLGLLYAALIGYQFLTGDMVTRVAIAASLLNFIVFFLSTLNRKPFSPKQQARRAQFHRENRASRQDPNGPLHRCAQCGRTEKDDPTLEFRYCSKCKGDQEYCQDHLFTHEHKK